eukprot:gene3510-3845_t
MNTLPLFPFTSSRVVSMILRRQASSLSKAVPQTGTALAKRSKAARRGVVVGAGATAMAWAIYRNVAFCAGEEDILGKIIASAKEAVAPFIPGAAGDPVKALIDQYGDVIQQLGLSGVFGACSAIALKRVSQQAAVVVGVIFAGLQGLAYAGYININYKKVSDDAQKAMDVTGDGKFDKEDVKVIWQHLYDILAYQLPNAGGFSAGFALGFRYF